MKQLLIISASILCGFTAQAKELDHTKYSSKLKRGIEDIIFKHKRQKNTIHRPGKTIVIRIIANTSKVKEILAFKKQFLEIGELTTHKLNHLKALSEYNLSGYIIKSKDLMKWQGRDDLTCIIVAIGTEKELKKIAKERSFNLKLGTRTYQYAFYGAEKRTGYRYNQMILFLPTEDKKGNQRTLPEMSKIFRSAALSTYGFPSRSKIIRGSTFVTHTGEPLNEFDKKLVKFIYDNCKVGESKSDVLKIIKEKWGK